MLYEYLFFRLQVRGCSETRAPPTLIWFSQKSCWFPPDKCSHCDPWCSVDCRCFLYKTSTNKISRFDFISDWIYIDFKSRINENFFRILDKKIETHSTNRKVLSCIFWSLWWFRRLSQNFVTDILIQELDGQNPNHDFSSIFLSLSKSRRIQWRVSPFFCRSLIFFFLYFTREKRDMVWGR